MHAQPQAARSFAHDVHRHVRNGMTAVSRAGHGSFAGNRMRSVAGRTRMISEKTNMNFNIRVRKAR